MPPYLAVFKSFTSVQADPFHDSVIAVTGGVAPPNAKADVLSAPNPFKKPLAVFKSPVSVQELPFQLSLRAT